MMSALFSFFFFNDTATTEIYTLSLHDALPILLTLGNSRKSVRLLVWRSSTRIWAELHEKAFRRLGGSPRVVVLDRKSTRLNSSHSQISYAVFCLKKKKIRPVLLVVLCALTALV